MKQAVEAVRNRDPEALSAAFRSLAAAMHFRNEVLPSLSPADCRWFWQEVMEPEQFRHTFEAMRDVVLAIASARGMVPSQVQGGYVDDTPVVHATDAARIVIFTELPAKRHSFLNALLIPFPE